MNRFLFATAALAALACTGQAAAAWDEPFAESNHVSWYRHRLVVRYDDIDTNTASGRAELLSRVEAAIKNGCEETEGPAWRDQCFKRVWSKTMGLATGAPRAALVAAVQERTGRQYANR